MLKLLKIALPVALTLSVSAVCAQASNSSRAFTYSTVSVATTTDPSGIWSPDELSPYNGQPVKIFNYSLKVGDKTYVASQIWNSDCDMSSCPTRLVLESPNGAPQRLSTDSMQQIIPPGDPKFKKSQGLPFAKHPFYLSSDGKSLEVNDSN